VAVQAPTGLAYTDLDAVYTRGVAIPPNLPSCAGGAVTAYSVSPVLPSGLDLNAASGVLAGTPLAVTPQATFWVTAANAAGSTTLALRIRVDDPAPEAPVVSLAGMVTAGRTGLAASTQDQGAGVEYVWILDGGTITSGQGTPAITYTAGAAGTLTATVGVSNTGGTASGSAIAQVVPAPDATMTANLSVHPGDSRLRASVPAQAGLTYAWSLLPGTSTGAITSGQGTSTIGFAAGGATGAFQIQVDVQNPAGEHAGTIRTVQVATGTWVVENGMPETEVFGGSATRLPDGRVLLAGGWLQPSISPMGAGPVAAAAIHDPAAGTLAPTGDMVHAALWHTATALGDGTVLVAGGAGAVLSPLGYAQIYDPASGTWSPTGALGAARFHHTATPLADGTVLVAGGNGSHSLASAEIYTPATSTWSPAGSLGTGRSSHTAVRLADGRVLVAGGYGESALASAEIFDPANGTWAGTGSLSAPRYGHAAVLLADGTVLVAGGTTSVPNAEIYHPASGTWTPAGAMAATRESLTATLLPGGKVLVTGGGGPSTELFDPASGLWTLTGSLSTGRTAPAAVLLDDGNVVVAFGGTKGKPVPEVEAYAP
jgi:PKD repeat protein